MNTVLYIDGSPLWLNEIKRNANGRITHGYVVNGDWELRLTDAELYAFENFYYHYGYGPKLDLKHQHEYTTYEEIEVSGQYHHRDYNAVIGAADLIRSDV